MNFVFTTDETCSRADEVVDYLRGPRLWIPARDYPDFSEWIDRTHGQLKSEEKRALLALSYGNVVGAIIYQAHKTIDKALEVKNITVRPDQRGRHIASFLLRNAEIEGAADFGSTHVLVDTKLRNYPVQAYLRRNGYSVKENTDLYRLGSGDDVVFTKQLCSTLKK